MVVPGQVAWRALPHAVVRVKLGRLHDKLKALEFAQVDRHVLAAAPSPRRAGLAIGTARRLRHEDLCAEENITALAHHEAGNRFNVDEHVSVLVDLEEVRVDEKTLVGVTVQGPGLDGVCDINP